MRFRKTSFLTKLLLLIVAVYAIITLVNLQDRVDAATKHINDLNEQVLFAEQEHALVEQELSELGTDKGTMKIARSRLGMVEVGEIVFCDADVD